MTSYTFATNLALNHDGNTDDEIVKHFRDILASISAPVGASSFELDPLTLSATAFSDVVAGITKIGFNDDVFSGNAFSRVFSYMPFGFGPTELMAWWYRGGGAALHRALTDAQGAAGDYVLIPVDLEHGETGGWFQEPITLQRMDDGLYKNGNAIKLRLYQESSRAVVLAFPNVATPPATPGVSFLDDAIAGVFTGGESNSIRGDASLLNGLFPNFPSAAGSIVTSGNCPHFYMAAPWTPSRIRWCVINKPFWNGAPDGSDILPPDATHLSVQQRAWITSAGESAALRNVAYSIYGQDELLKTMQDGGAIVHEQFPNDVLQALRDAVNQIHDDHATSASAGPYAGCAFVDLGAVPVGAPNVRLTDASRPFRSSDSAKQIAVADATSAGNNGAFQCKRVADDGSWIEYINPGVVAEAFAPATTATALADEGYKQILNSVRAHARANQVRARANVVDETLRFAARPLYQPNLATDRKR